MDVKRTTIEEGPSLDPKVTTSTKTVTNPNIHHEVVEGSNVAIDTPSSSTVQQTRVVQEPLVKTEHPQKIFEKKKSIFRVSQLIWTILGIIELLLGFRIALKAIGADPTSGFTDIIYAVSQPLALPFSGILQANAGTGQSVFEWSTIIAAVVYGVIAIGLIQLLSFMRPVTPEEIEQNV